ncbi:hypothetical protein BGX30_010680 [Mortierella sp. GBA39]|nr:hypothetical protein BGX30_010680 [Mortierella sp. GBA39]
MHTKDINIVDKVPTEVILKFAPYFDRSTLFKALRVCRRWSKILGHLAWSHIAKTDWHLPYFPIQQQNSESISTLNDSLLSPFLQYVQTLEWYNNLSLLPTDIVTNPQIQIPIARLAHILAMTPNLTRLSLRIVGDHPDPSLFDSIRNLLHLKSLDIDLPAQPTQAPLETLFPLFAHLGELILDRCWYSNIYEKDKSTFTLLHPNEQQQWKIQRMTIDSINVPLIQHCPALEELRIFHPRQRTIAQEHAASGAVAWKLRKPSALKTLDIYCAERATSYSFKIHDASSEDVFRPHLLLRWESQKWWSTQDITALF